MQYLAYEMAHTMLQPMRLATKVLKQQADISKSLCRSPSWAHHVSAMCELFEGLTRRYGKPEWGITQTTLHGLEVPVTEEIVWRKPFCNLVHFDRSEEVVGKRYDPKLLIIAPLSGHYATLLRGTVREMIKEHNVYVTDWVDARDVPLVEGGFDLDDFIDYLIEMLEYLGPNTHVMAVCQPSVPALAATALLAESNSEFQPTSLTLMGGPIDTTRNPTAVNELAARRSIDWFRNKVVASVPFPNIGAMRPVYPGFLQLTGFMTMNLERHTQAHSKLFDNLVKGDCDSVRAHKEFYEEYLAVMDLPAEFYLQCIETVFQNHALPLGKMRHRGQLIDCRAIEKTAIITVEGERDDICGLGQTEAAHDLCTNVPVDEHYHYVQPGVGHYGVFNGTRFRAEIAPRIRQMIRAIQFKRRTDDSVRFAQPYRSLRSERDTQYDWRTGQPKDDKTLH